MYVIRKALCGYIRNNFHRDKQTYRGNQSLDDGEQLLKLDTFVIIKFYPEKINNRKEVHLLLSMPFRGKRFEKIIIGKMTFLF